MSQDLVRPSSRLNRRAALGGIGVTAALGLGGQVGHANAQDSTPGALATHPIVGAWLVMTPAPPSPAVFTTDGFIISGTPANYVDPEHGVVFQGVALGAWEPLGERQVLLSFTQTLTDASGAFLGTFTVEGHPMVSDDGQIFTDDTPDARLIFRDASNTIVSDVVVAAGVMATRITPGSVLFPTATPEAAGTQTAEGQTATINGVELYYEEHGDADGQPVLLLHGGIGNTEEFDGLLPDLVAAGYRTIAMDCRGRGRSSWGEEPITYELMASDALGLLDLLRIARTSIVGWSDGAIIGLELAVTAPERLERVVAYGANFIPDGVHAPIESDQLPPFEKFVVDYQRLSPQPERFDDLLEELDALYKVAPNFSEDELKSITVPVLILDGAEEEIVNADQPVRMAELIPGAELVIMPGTGHFAPFEQPEKFNRVVLDFLQA